MTMNMTALSALDRFKVLRFAASFVWADHEIADSERRFLAELATELDVEDGAREVALLLERPPRPEDIDPSNVPAGAADVVRHAALRAIAADGAVEHEEMAMFDLLDELLPRTER